jgi:hypothetical protein
MRERSLTRQAVLFTLGRSQHRNASEPKEANKERAAQITSNQQQLITDAKLSDSRPRERHRHTYSHRSARGRNSQDAQGEASPRGAAEEQQTNTLKPT